MGLMRSVYRYYGLIVAQSQGRVKAGYGFYAGETAVSCVVCSSRNPGALRGRRTISFDQTVVTYSKIRVALLKGAPVRSTQIDQIVVTRGPHTHPFRIGGTDDTPTGPGIHKLPPPTVQQQDLEHTTSAYGVILLRLHSR